MTGEIASWICLKLDSFKYPRMQPAKLFVFEALSKRADPISENTGDKFSCAPAQLFGAARLSIPTAAQCGFEVRFERPEPLHLSASPCTAGYRRPIETTNEFARINLGGTTTWFRGEQNFQFARRQAFTTMLWSSSCPMPQVERNLSASARKDLLFTAG